MKKATASNPSDSHILILAQMEIPSEEVEEKSEEVSRTYRIPTSTSFTTSAEESVERTEAETPRITEAVITEITSLGKVTVLLYMNGGIFYCSA